MSRIHRGKAFVLGVQISFTDDSLLGLLLIDQGLAFGGLDAFPEGRTRLSCPPQPCEPSQPTVRLNQEKQLDLLFPGQIVSDPKG